MSLQNTAVLPHTVFPYLALSLIYYAICLLSQHFIRSLQVQAVKLIHMEYSALTNEVLCMDLWIHGFTAPHSELRCFRASLKNRHTLATVLNLHRLLLPNLLLSLMTQLPSTTWLNLLTQTTLQQMKLGNMVAAKGAFPQMQIPTLKAQRPLRLSSPVFLIKNFNLFLPQQPSSLAAPSLRRPSSLSQAVSLLNLILCCWKTHNSM